MKYSENQALTKMAAYCSKAERAPYDIRRKLQGWEVDPDIIDRIIKQLIKENFLNEERYCRSFIKDKLQFNKWGKTKIVFELRKKQISQSIIDSSFDEIENNEFEVPLKKILITKEKSIKAGNDYEKRMKLIRFALGRGYPLELIQKCLTEILKGNQDEYFDTFS